MYSLSFVVSIAWVSLHHKPHFFNMGVHVGKKKKKAASCSMLLMITDSFERFQGLKYPLLVKRFACMVMSGVVSANYLHILQPDILYPKMITQVTFQADFYYKRGF